MKRVVLLAFALVGACKEPPLPTCTPDTGAPALDAPTVCAHLATLRCVHDDDPDLDALAECQAAYTDFEAKVAPAEFARLTHCYAEATSCGDVGRCSLACVAPAVDAGP